MKKYISIIFFFLFFAPSISSGQSKIILGGDTMVAIKPEQVKVINSAFLDLEYTKKEVALKDSIISLDKKHIDNLGEIVKSKDELMKEKVKEAKKNTFLKTLCGVLSGIIVGLLL